MKKPGNGNGLQRLLTAKEVEELTKIDVKTIYAYVQRGLIPYVRIESSVRFPEDDIRAWIRSEERRVGKECRSRWSPYH